MEFFDDLGARLSARWQRFGFDRDAFPSVAEDELHRRLPHEAVDSTEILRWLGRTAVLPYQQHFESSFGQPALTVFWHPRFYVTALFWATSTTAIHEHGFGGAFTVLEGASLQSTYRFEAAETLGERVLLGDLHLVGSTVLERGAVQRVEAGERFIHSAFHIGFPSVTILVRTHGGRVTRPQYQYLPPHLAIDAQHEDQLSTRRLQALGLLDTLDSPEYQPYACDAIRHGDLTTCCLVLRQAFSSRARRPEAFDAAAAAVRARCGEARVVKLVRVFEEAERNELVFAARTRITDPGLRLLLALLLKHADWPSVIDLVHRYTRVESPVEYVLDGLATFADAGILGFPYTAEMRATVAWLIHRATGGDNGPSHPELAARAHVVASSRLLRPLVAPLAAAAA
jgi:hypothetical protein